MVGLPEVIEKLLDREFLPTRRKALAVAQELLAPLKLLGSYR